MIDAFVRNKTRAGDYVHRFGNRADMDLYRMPSSERIKFLKDRFLASERQLCSERATIVTEAYKAFAHEPPLMKRAKTLHMLLGRIHVFISDSELIVGHHASMPKSAPVFPEFDVGWLEEELELLPTRSVDSFFVSDRVKEDLINIFPYWKDKGIRRVLFNSLPETTLNHRMKAKVFSVTAHEETALGHVLLDYEKVIRIGFEGIKREVCRALEALDPKKPDYVERALFYRSCMVSCDAAIVFAKRYAERAESMAQSECDEKRKEELFRIAEVCRQVPAKPARNFHESLQSLWFVQIIVQIDNNGSSYSPGRIDQYLLPYYRKDVASGVLTREGAQELLDCFWLKFSEPLLLYKTEAARITGGFPMGQNVTVGGVDGEGNDATNELSFLCLNAQEHVGLAQPNFTVRVSRKAPRAFLMRTAEVIRLGTGMPQLMNDGVCIPAVQNVGIPVREARRYAPVGCVELNVVGGWGRENGGYFNLAKVLEYTINNGVCRLTGEQDGLPLGSLSDFDSFESLLSAFRKQMAYFFEHLAIEDNAIDRVHADLVPSPIVSVLVPGCIESAREVTAGGARYNFTGPTAVGGANTGNSLAAIKKLVFEDKSVGASELQAALDADFVGYETLQAMLREKAPKFGNNDDYVDGIVKQLVESFADEAERYTNGRGGRFRPGLTAVTAHVGMGKEVGATPDGRRAKTPLAGGISPYSGTDMNGPTASAASVAKVDFVRFGKGMIFNQTFSPSALETVEGLSKFVDYFLAYFDLGGMHVQFNVITKEKLLEAKAKPAEYRGLVVRVAGYSAIFVNLSEEVQDQVIQRTVHAGF
jgi:pyruvate formate-lyase/glycerol dehydratase family glycyl radical enzyme